MLVSSIAGPGRKIAVSLRLSQTNKQITTKTYDNKALFENIVGKGD